MKMEKSIKPKHFIVEAKFIGKNSLGYEKNTIYFLKINNYNSMEICKIDGTCKCCYQSLSSFLSNWTNIKNI